MNNTKIGYLNYRLEQVEIRIAEATKFGDELSVRSLNIEKGQLQRELESLSSDN